MLPHTTQSLSFQHQVALAHTAPTSIWEAIMGNSIPNIRRNLAIRAMPNKQLISKQYLTLKAHILSLASPIRSLPTSQKHRLTTTKNHSLQ